MDIYQQNILDYYKHPRKQGELTKSTHHAEVANPLCGDRLELWLEVEDSVITKAHWTGEGCVLSLASADILAEYLEGKQASQARAITGEWIKKELCVELGPNRLKCALLSVDALSKALPN